ncbi:MAG: methyltransferase domain-containing protein [Alphaproteobacteria bacterium]|nr:methyltransferase domain-containing protein [Alphaproteobacteria bacterium]
MQWKFDEKVAAEFDSIAQKQIPNYDIVINRCIELVSARFQTNPNAKVIDIGSARGRTLTRLYDAGFSNIYGVESSPHMKAASAFSDRIILSERFPSELAPFDAVLANWTLHFINNRESYIQDIFHGLQPNGIFIFTDRMLGSTTSYERYLDFKRKNGVSEADIKAKEAALVGVLEPRPLAWYQTILQKIGFADIEIIDAAWCFNTVMCRKP